jgi:hypothetical protein
MEVRSNFALPMLWSVVAIAAGVLPSSVCVGQTMGSGCRSLPQQIWYDLVPPRNAHKAWILQLKGEAGHTSITAGFRNGPHATSDYGEHWTPLTDKRSIFSATLWGTVAPSNPNTIYQYESNGVITRSEDSGNTWVKPSPKVDGRSAAAIALLMSGHHHDDYVIEFEIAAVHPLRPLTIYATAIVGPPRRPEGDFREQYPLSGMYVSDDGGENWTQFSNSVGLFNKHGNRYAVLGISPSNTDVMFAEGERGVLRSSDGGRTWRSVGQSDLLNLQPLDTEDRAAGIQVPNRQVPLHPTEFVFDPNSEQVIYMVSRKGVHRSLDGGDSWVLLDLGFDRLNSVNSVAVDPLQPNKVFAGADRGLFMSEDQGCTFVKMHEPEP